MEKLKILSEFQSVKEYQNFMAGITKEKDVKTRIKDLMRMRKNGITKTSDSIEFEVQRVRRNNKKKNEKRRQQQNAILGEAAAELNLTLAHSPISIKSEDMGTCGSAAQSPITKLDFGVPSSPRHQEEKVCLIFNSFWHIEISDLTYKFLLCFSHQCTQFFPRQVIKCCLLDLAEADAINNCSVPAA